MKHYTHILFDWDGCLADTMGIWLQAAQEILSREGVGASLDDIFTHIGAGGIMQYYPVPDPEASQREFVALASQRLHSAPLYEGAKDCLRALTDSKTLAIVTDCRPDILSRSMEHNDVCDYFATVVTRQESEQFKPHPAGIEYALKQLGADPATTLMIGDRDKDLLAARNAGVDSLLFYPPSHANYYDLAHLKTCGPVYVASSYIEIIDFLL